MQIYDGFSYRSSNILKNGDKVYRCSSLKGCSASITTDPEGTAVVKTKNTHSHDRDEHKAETRQLRVRVRQNSGDISKLPSQVIRGQSWWRKIQSLGLSADYKDKDSDLGKWLTHFFGLAYLSTDMIEECFVELIDDAPSDDKCMKFRQNIDMKMQVEAYYFCILIKVAEKLVNGQYYSKCQQPEVITFIKDPILTNSCASVLYGSIMCNSIRGCDMFKMTMNTCMFHRSNAGCNEIGVHNTRMFKKLACRPGWSLTSNICYIQTTQTVTCNEAQTSCLDLGGIAAEFYSTEEMDDALTVITSNVYVGGFLQNGVFLWDDSQQQVDSALWLPDEPVGGDCVQIWKDKKGLDALNWWFYNSVLCQQVIYMS
ncbi:Hypothetical predicted protein [Mytilus galloprovincialis]|uniref:C-type lectin domain-containing protein n=1 Tax=Mytilus galloprovincialis TaxID=29158 RepID=A0A8B6F221_MYTGA|nr:Hypothetical predicted protein [Mytilus galloprovincialis]